MVLKTIDYLIKDINKRVLGLIQDRIDSSLKNIIQSRVFDSSRALYEEGVANSLANFMKYIYEGALKVSPTYSDKLVRQSFHFLNYLIIEKHEKCTEYNIYHCELPTYSYSYSSTPKKIYPVLITLRAFFEIFKKKNLLFLGG